MSIQKFVFFTDTHFHKFSNFSKEDDTTGNSRFTEQLDTLQKVFDIAWDNQAVLLNGGDLFHNRGSVETDVFNKVYELFLRNSNTLVLNCVGNHDMQTNRLGAPNSLNTFSHTENSWVFSEPYVYRMSKIDIYVLPYGDEVEDIKEWLNSQEVDESKTNILVGHLGLDGAKTGSSNHRLAGAFSYSDLRPEVMDYILLGHYHKRQLINEFNPKHLYGGSLLQNNFGETHDTGVYLLTVDTDNKENNEIEFIPVESTQFVTVDANDLPENLDEIMKNHYVRFKGKSEDVKALENVVDDLSNVQVDLQEDYSKDSRMDYNETSSPSDIVKQYIDEFLDGDELIKEVSVNALKNV